MTLGVLQILELMEGGDLRNALSGLQREEMTWYQNGQHLALDIIRGICYLHNNRVIHGDLKVGCLPSAFGASMTAALLLGYAALLAAHGPEESYHGSYHPHTLSCALQLRPSVTEHARRKELRCSMQPCFD